MVASVGVGLVGFGLVGVGLVGGGGLVGRRLSDQWKKDHQTEQKLNEKEVKWVSGPSSLLCLPDEEEGESEGGVWTSSWWKARIDVSEW